MIAASPAVICKCMQIAVSRRGSLARGANERDGGSVHSAVFCAAGDQQCR